MKHTASGARRLVAGEVMDRACCTPSERRPPPHEALRKQRTRNVWATLARKRCWEDDVRCYSTSAARGPSRGAKFLPFVARLHNVKSSSASLYSAATRRAGSYSRLVRFVRPDETRPHP